MLASLLPGVRDLRTPLAAGYTLALTLWILFSDKIPDQKSATGIADKLYDLGDLMGRPAVVAAWSFIAYIVGSVLLVREFPDIPLLRRSRFGRPAELNRVRLAEYVEMSAGRLVGRSGRPGFWDLFPADMGKELSDFDSATRDAEITSYVRAIIARELGQLAVRLQGQNQGLYDSYDRLRAEAELRATLFVPLTALIVTLAATWHWTAILLLLLPTILYVQGWIRYQEARTVVSTALMVGIIESPTIERVTKWLDGPQAQAPLHGGLQ